MRLTFAAAALLFLAGCAPRFPRELPQPFGRPTAAPPASDDGHRCQTIWQNGKRVCEPPVAGP